MRAEREWRWRARLSGASEKPAGGAGRSPCSSAETAVAADRTRLARASRSTGGDVRCVSGRRRGIRFPRALGHLGGPLRFPGPQLPLSSWAVGSGAGQQECPRAEITPQPRCPAARTGSRRHSCQLKRAPGQTRERGPRKSCCLENSLSWHFFFFSFAN